MKRLRAPLIHSVLIAFLFNSFGPWPCAQASPLAADFRLPTPGVMIHLSPEFNPPILKGIKVHPDNPFRFDFILDQGDALKGTVPSTLFNKGLSPLKQEATKLIKYFLASLTIPEKDLWVNLSPYEKDRIIPQSFGLTEMGRDLLAEDYMLKQITASLIYPEDAIGKKFWKRIYAEAAKKFDTTNVAVNTFNKVWIVPDKAVVYENAKAGTAYVVEAKLKVMLEQDYLALEKNRSQPGDMFKPEQQRTCPQAGCQANQALKGQASQGNHLTPNKDTSALGSQIVREVVIPELTKEVNQGKNFAQLRQVYNSLILATWYKKKIKDSILAQVYADRNKTAGVGYEKSLSSPNVLIGDPEHIYQQYLKAFKKGVYNYIKEEQDPVTQETIPRKYFSGGTTFDDAAMAEALNFTSNEAVLAKSQPDHAMVIKMKADPVDTAMSSHQWKEGDIVQDEESLLWKIDGLPQRRGAGGVLEDWVLLKKGRNEKLISIAELSAKYRLHSEVKAPSKKSAKGSFAWRIEDIEEQINFLRSEGHVYQDDNRYALIFNHLKHIENNVRSSELSSDEAKSLFSILIKIVFTAPIEASVKDSGASLYDNIQGMAQNLLDILISQLTKLEYPYETEKIIQIRNPMAADVLKELAIDVKKIDAQRLESSMAWIVRPFSGLSQIKALQKRYGNNELEFVIFKTSQGETLIGLSGQGESTAKHRLHRFGLGVGHTHGFSVPLEASEADTEIAEGSNWAMHFILALDKRTDTLELAYYDHHIHDWRYIRDSSKAGQEAVRKKLIEFGILKDRAMTVLRDEDITRLAPQVGENVYIAQTLGGQLHNVPHEVLDVKQDATQKTLFHLTVLNLSTIEEGNHDYDVLEAVNSFKFLTSSLPGFASIETSIAGVLWVQYTNRLYQFLANKNHPDVSEDRKWRIYLRPADIQSLQLLTEAVKEVALEINGPLEFKYLSQNEPTLQQKLNDPTANRFVINFASQQDARDFYQMLIKNPKYAMAIGNGQTLRAENLDKLAAIAQGHTARRNQVLTAGSKTGNNAQVAKNQAMNTTSLYRGLRAVSLDAVVKILEQGETPIHRDDDKLRFDVPWVIHGSGLLDKNNVSTSTRFGAARMYAFWSYLSRKNYEQNGGLKTFAIIAQTYPLQAKIMFLDAFHRLMGYKIATRGMRVIHGSSSQVLAELARIKDDNPQAVANVIYKAGVQYDQIRWKSWRIGHYIVPSGQEVGLTRVYPDQIKEVWVYVSGMKVDRAMVASDAKIQAEFPTDALTAERGAEALYAMLDSLPRDIDNKAVYGLVRSLLQVYTGVSPVISFVDEKGPDSSIKNVLIKAIRTNENLRVIEFEKNKYSVINLRAAQRVLQANQGVLLDNQPVFPSDDVQGLLDHVEEWVNPGKYNTIVAVRYGLLSGYPRNAAIKYLKFQQALAKIGGFLDPVVKKLLHPDIVPRSQGQKDSLKSELAEKFSVLTPEELDVLVDAYWGDEFLAFSEQDNLWRKQLLDIARQAQTKLDPEGKRYTRYYHLYEFGTSPDWAMISKEISFDQRLGLSASDQGFLRSIHGTGFVGKNKKRYQLSYNQNASLYMRTVPHLRGEPIDEFFISEIDGAGKIIKGRNKIGWIYIYPKDKGGYIQKDGHLHIVIEQVQINKADDRRQGIFSIFLNSLPKGTVLTVNNIINKATLSYMVGIILEQQSLSDALDQSLVQYVREWFKRSLDAHGETTSPAKVYLFLKTYQEAGGNLKFVDLNDVFKESPLGQSMRKGGFSHLQIIFGSGTQQNLIMNYIGIKDFDRAMMTKADRQQNYQDMVYLRQTVASLNLDLMGHGTSSPDLELAKTILRSGYLEHKKGSVQYGAVSQLGRMYGPNGKGTGLFIMGHQREVEEVIKDNKVPLAYIQYIVFSQANADIMRLDPEFVAYYAKIFSYRELADKLKADNAMAQKNTGGIDLTPAHMNLQTKMPANLSDWRGLASSAGGDSRRTTVSVGQYDVRGNDKEGSGDDNGGIRFHLDPAQLAQLRNAPGFVPVVIDIQPLLSLSAFLGIKEETPKQ